MVVARPARTTTTAHQEAQSRDNNEAEEEEADSAVAIKKLRLTERQLHAIVRRTVFITLTDGGVATEMDKIERIAARMNAELDSDLVDPRGFDKFYDP